MVGIATVGIAALVPAGLSAAAPATVPAAAAAVSAGAPGVFSKVAVDSAGNPVTSVAPGDTVNWVVTLPQSSAASTALDLTDQIEAPQSYVPDSLAAPTGLAKTQPTGPNGTLHVTGTVNPTGTAAVEKVPPPARTFATPQTGGDGYTPILLGSKVYNLYHHFNGTGTTGGFINCFNQAAPVARCADYPAGTYLSTTGGGMQPFGQGLNDFVTARQNQGYLDRTNGRYYVAGANLAKDIGVLCLNLLTRTGCGWTPVQAGYGFSGSGTASYPFVQNGAFANGNYYALTRSGRVICVVTATMAPCPNQPGGPFPSATTGGFDVGLPSPPVAGSNPSWGSTMHLIGSQIIVTIPRTGNASNVEVSCLDPATNTACAGAYPFALRGSTAANNASGALPTLSAAGAVTGYCINLNNGANDAGTTIAWDCFNPAGAVVQNPPNFAALTFGYSKQGLAEFTTFGSRVYYPSQQRTTADAYVCYDFTASAPCTGAFPVRPTAISGSGGVAGALVGYSLVSDPDVPTCIWELGDFGQYFQFDAVTGGNCENAGTTAIVNVAPNFCAPNAGPISYDQVTIAGLLPSQARAASRVSVLAADGVTPIPGFSVPFTSDTLDISPITYPSYLGLDTSKIFVRLDLVSPDPAAWTPPKQPTVSVSFKGPGLQVCYQTTVPTGCAVAGRTISNTAQATVDKEPVAPVTAKLSVVAKPGTCLVHAAVKKITDPPGQEAGWTFRLTGPGLSTAGVPVVTTDTGAILFADSGTPVNLAQSGTYAITETVRTGWSLTTVGSGNDRTVTADLAADRCTFDVSLPADQDANALYQCDFTNTENPTPPPTTPPTTPPAPPTVPPTTPPAPPLPVTGASVGPLIGIALALLVAGGALVGATRLRRRHQH